MTQTEAKLIDALRHNYNGTGRVTLLGKRDERAARILEEHHLVCWIDAGSPDNDQSIVGQTYPAIVWA